MLSPKIGGPSVKPCHHLEDAVKLIRVGPYPPAA